MKAHRAGALFLVSLLFIGPGMNPVAPQLRAQGKSLQERPCTVDVKTTGNSRNAPGNVKKQCPAGSSSGIAKGDFNGDGYADLAVGVPDEDDGTVVDAGAVTVIYGSANGLTTTDASVPASQFWSLGSTNIPGSLHAGDRFGAALASGDFNGDGYSDLAIGIPNREVVTTGLFGAQTNHTDAGAVVIIYGSPKGLTSTDASVPLPQFFDMNSIPNVTDSFTVDYSHFGGSLAWGDFNHDGKGDLVIGIPRASLNTGLFSNHTYNGGLWVLYGTSIGLRLGGNQVLTENSLSIGIRENSFFGTGLTSGDFNGDGYPELAIGAPGYDVGCSSQCISGAGAVFILKGTSSGLSTSGVQAWTEGSPGVPKINYYASEPYDHFGASLTAGDFNGDGKADLAIGTPQKDLIAPDQYQHPGLGFAELIFDSAGAAYVVYGSTSGLTGTNAQAFTLDTVFGTGSGDGDEFGKALAAGDFNGDGRADLAIGSPYKFSGGQVDVIYGSASGLNTANHQFFPDWLVPGLTAQDGEQFGASLTAWNFGRDAEPFGLPPSKTADLVIGIPNRTVGNAINAGAIFIFYGSRVANGFPSQQLWTQNEAGCCSESYDHFGAAVY